MTPMTAPMTPAPTVTLSDSDHGEDSSEAEVEKEIRRYAQAVRQDRLLKRMEERPGRQLPAKLH